MLLNFELVKSYPILPVATGGSIRSLKYADEVIQYSDEVIKYGDDLIEGVGKATPSGNQYSNMFEANITGSSRGAHRSQANKQFFNALESNPGFAKQVDDFFGYDTMKYMKSGKGNSLLNPSKD